MRTLFTFFVFTLISFSVTSQEFKFKEETIDYGKISKNADGEKTFIFTNVGNKPLVISKIQSSCGCTIPKKPKKPIFPGEKGEIKVAYDTKRVGGVSKSITIFSNAKSPRKIIRIKGIVVNGIILEKEKNMLSDF